MGDLDLTAVQHRSRNADDQRLDLSLTIDEDEPEAQKSLVASEEEEPAAVDPTSYKPAVSVDGVWTLTETDIGTTCPVGTMLNYETPTFSAEWIADGCAVLGCGGGGAPYTAFLTARVALREGRVLRVVSPSYVASKDPEAWVLPCGFMGSPSVSSERIPSGEEIPTACTGLMKFLGVTSVAAIIS